MHAVAIATLCLAATLGIGFLLAGFCALLAHHDGEIRRFQTEYARARDRGPWQEYLAHWRIYTPPMIVAHWQTRPEVRKSVWVGVIASLIATVAAHFV